MSATLVKFEKSPLLSKFELDQSGNGNFFLVLGTKGIGSGGEPAAGGGPLNKDVHLVIFQSGATKNQIYFSRKIKNINISFLRNRNFWALCSEKHTVQN